MKQLHWRSIGPAVMGGRISDISVDPKDPYTIYVALATGGVIKSVNDGNTWKPIFEHEPVASVGAIAVDPSNSKIVWTGTGEANGRNSSSWGDGIYKSTDGGSTWKNMGLKKTREIGRILIDPKHSDTIYVAAAGQLWGRNKERGLYKTTDGGKSWKHVLKFDAKTGVIDVTFAGKDNSVILAAAYKRLRTPWGFHGIGNKAGIYRSVDGGEHWTKCIKGLPDYPVGRIGLSVCASKPDIAYAVIECNEGGAKNLFNPHSNFGGVFRSDDSGVTWKKVNSTVPRGFYFGNIRVDPLNPDRVYVLGFGLEISKDGGKTFNIPGYGSSGVHPDLHAMWIDPEHPAHSLLGTDGGLYVSRDYASTWEFVNNFPMGEFYECSVDNRQPFWVYGGLQDNGCWGGPNALHSSRGPENHDWVSFPAGDGFYVLTDPINPNVVYAESQNGEAYRLNRKTHTVHNMSPKAPEGSPDYRFNWTTPICISPFNNDIVYTGGSHLFKFTDKCKYYSPISPDLSKQVGRHISSNGSGAEVYGTVVSISASSLSKGMIWIGTDDGNIQLTQDEGTSWQNLTDNLPEKVRNYWVTRITASSFYPGRAYAAIDGHRSDDLSPYLFVTEDYGKTWRAITDGLPKEGPIQAFREDPINPDLLFAGTEFGAWVSMDRGGRWRKLGENLPTVAVDDLAIQARDHAIVAATHGRSLWVLDDIAPLESITRHTDASKPLLFPIAPGVEYRGSFGGNGYGQHNFVAENPPSGVQIIYWLPELADSAPVITITNSKGASVATLYGKRYPGVERVSWDMHKPARPGDDGEDFHAPLFVPSGVYTVTLTTGKTKLTQQVSVTGPGYLSKEVSDVPASDPDEIGH